MVPEAPRNFPKKVKILRISLKFKGFSLKFEGLGGSRGLPRPPGAPLDGPRAPPKFLNFFEKVHIFPYLGPQIPPERYFVVLFNELTKGPGHRPPQEIKSYWGGGE